MKTRNAFIDTCCIESANFQFDSDPLSQIQDLAIKGKIRLITTWITVEEVHARMKKHCQQAKEALFEARNKARIARNIKKEPFLSLFQGFDWKELFEANQENFSRFIEQTMTLVLPCS